MKTLLIMRHAKSSWADDGMADHDRPLNGRGERDAPRMGRFLAHKEFAPEVVLSSSAARAKVTAREVIQAARWNVSPSFSQSLYLASAGDIAEYLTTLPGHVACAMFVGHNPGVEELVAELTGNFVAMPTSAVAVVQLDANRWRDLKIDGDHRLLHHWYPKGLPQEI